MRLPDERTQCLIARMYEEGDPVSKISHDLHIGVRVVIHVLRIMAVKVHPPEGPRAGRISAEEIAHRAAQVRKGWSKAERRRRMGTNAPQHVVITPTRVLTDGRKRLGGDS